PAGHGEQRPRRARALAPPRGRGHLRTRHVRQRPVENAPPAHSPAPCTRLRRMPSDKEQRDSAYWEAVEEATELLQERRFEDALLALRDVIKTQPNNPYAYHYLGAAFFETKHLEAARDAYRAALRLAPEYLGARVALSHVLRMLGDTNGALAAAKEALRRFPKDAEAMHAAGLAHAARGNRS